MPSTPPLSLPQIRFDDYFWDDAIAFLRDHASLEQRFLLPDELCNLFLNASSYHQVHAETSPQFDWALLHKGRLFSLSDSVLETICRSFVPVFANEVFVLFSSLQISRLKTIPPLIRSPHVKALQLKLRERNVKQSLHAQPISKFLKQGNTKPKLTLLIEQDKRNHWFSRPVDFVPLSWAATSSKHPYANLGDALSPILVSALSGLPVVHRDFDSWQRRLACAGTIAHGFKHGAVHFWGTGIDRKKNPVDANLLNYQKPANTNFHVHAVRGPFTAEILQRQGIAVPSVYGDPVWFLPSLIKPAPEQRYELGVVVHLTELAERTNRASVDPNLLRYQIPPSLQDSIRIITTLTEPSFAALEARVQAITACKRIVSTSLHGLVISEAYGIPCVALRTTRRGAAFARLEDERERVDWRIRDFYSGVGVQQLFVYGQQRFEPTDWENLIAAIDRYWSPLTWSPDCFLDAFPLPLTFNPLEGKPFGNRHLLEKIKL
ncbi:polysaccharide pyruvyl transferase family protein [Leptolyngbya sp. NK1-12]|uniref:Polysaccharide pyruvyl transferase family protein n=1 Tax=Leptolyngbya sp. NK1-12 TaxID=2547451 RepID=A0AA96WLV7_9CYAN|nr:polysaccharide pyruvyl transferase family protein [Leptolyngbya sp. NK1-12]WNZ27065.1 polysaccharide pyruvyl transferase family protein [Leptolyngbya sp. NK1-12]